MKCPACGFETPDAQDWCDFCKEPFRRKKEEVPRAEKPVEAKSESLEQQRAPALKRKPAVTPKLLAKLEVQRTQSKGEDLTRGALPPEFASLDSGERIPMIPPIVRKMAWLFLAIVMLWVVVFSVVAMRRVNSGDTGGKVTIVR